MTRAIVLGASAMLVLVALACGETKSGPTASVPTGAGSWMPSTPTPGEFDAGAAERSTLAKVTTKGAADGRYVVSAVIVRIENGAVVATDDFADSATWTVRAPDIANLDKRFIVNGRYRLLILVQNGEPRIIDGGAAQ